MPTFQITGPDGTKYRVEGPEGSTEEQALAKVKAQSETKPETPPASFGETALDVGKSFATGIAKGAEAFPGAMASAMGAVGRAVEPALESIGIGDPAEREKREQFRKENPLPMATSALPEPKTTAGKFAQSVGEFVPGAAASPGGAVARGIAAVGGGVGSEAAGELTESRPELQPYAKLVGGAVGAMAPAIGARAITPLPATALHRANVSALENEGVSGLTAGQRTGYRPLRYAEEHLGGSPTAGRAAEEAMTEPREQFTRAALARVGENADRATPEVIDRAFSRIGNDFDTLAARNSAPVDQQYIQDLLRAQADYDFLFVDPLKKPLVQNVVDHALNKLQKTNLMTGEEYQAMRSRVERMRRAQRQDPEMNEFLASVRDAMDNLMERSMSPADAAAWQQARNQYRNLLVLEKATTGAETGGIITPAKLKQGAVGQNRRAYARGQGDFAELARAGENVMPGLPQSGTAPRLLTEAGPVKLATTGATGRALMSSPLQGYLGNQVMSDVIANLPPARAAAVLSLIGNAGPLAQTGQER